MSFYADPARRGWQDCPSPNGTNYEKRYIRFYQRDPPRPVTFKKPTFWPATIAMDQKIERTPMNTATAALRRIDAAYIDYETALRRQARGIAVDSYTGPSRDRRPRRARDEEPAMTAAEASEHMRDRYADLCDRLEGEELEEFKERHEGVFGEDAGEPPPFPGRPRTGGEIDPSREGEDRRRRMAGDRMAFDKFAKAYPGAAAIEVHPVARPTRTGARSLSNAAATTFERMFPNAAKIGFSR
jgi:hypothetical protein